MLSPRTREIRVALVGVGNCASSLVQGLAYYRSGANNTAGLMHREIGAYRPEDIRVVAAWDVDRRKVGRDVSEAIFAKPNCTAVFCAKVGTSGTKVRMGRVLDGVAEHMAVYPDERSFRLADEPEPAKEEVVSLLRETEAGVPIIGDDIKAQLGATIVHRVLTDLFRKRGVKLERTYQLKTGGNTDFLNMLERSRLARKKESKTEAVQSVAAVRLDDENIHVGPSDYVAWQNDNKVCFLRMEGQLFGGVPMNLELRLSVEDSPNSAGVAIDMIRCAKLARDRGLAGPIEPAAAFFCKHPPRQIPDDEAWAELEDFLAAD